MFVTPQMAANASIIHLNVENYYYGHPRDQALEKRIEMKMFVLVNR